MVTSNRQKYDAEDEKIVVVKCKGCGKPIDINEELCIDCEILVVGDRHDN